MWRPDGLRAGFHAELGAHASGLSHAGEQWVPTQFRVGWHAHPVWELYLQVHGASRWSAGGRDHTLAPGHLLAVAPGVAHQMVERSAGAHHFYFAGVDPAPALARHPSLAGSCFGSGRAGPGMRAAAPVVHRPDAATLAEPFAGLVGELTVRRSYPDEGLGLAVDRLLLEVARLLAPGPGTPRLAGHPAVARVRALLDREYRRHWTLAELAGRVGLAPTYLAGLFTRELGMPPHRYLRERRIGRARQLLRGSDLPVTAIALETGFASGQHLARVFRDVTGHSPRQYRSLASMDKESDVDTLHNGH